MNKDSKIVKFGPIAALAAALGIGSYNAWPSKSPATAVAPKLTLAENDPAAEGDGGGYADTKLSECLTKPIGSKVRLRFYVASDFQPNGSEVLLLNSMKKYRDAGNVTTFVRSGGTKGAWVGRTVTIEGVVSEYRGKRQITADHVRP